MNDEIYSDLDFEQNEDYAEIIKKALDKDTQNVGNYMKEPISNDTYKNIAYGVGGTAAAAKIAESIPQSIDPIGRYWNELPSYNPIYYPHAEQPKGWNPKNFDYFTPTQGIHMNRREMPTFYKGTKSLHNQLPNSVADTSSFVSVPKAETVAPDYSKLVKNPLAVEEIELTPNQIKNGGWDIWDVDAKGKPVSWQFGQQRKNALDALYADAVKTGKIQPYIDAANDPYYGFIGPLTNQQFDKVNMHPIDYNYKYGITKGAYAPNGISKMTSPMYDRRNNRYTNALELEDIMLDRSNAMQQQQSYDNIMRQFEADRIAASPIKSKLYNAKRTAEDAIDFYRQFGELPSTLTEQLPPSIRNIGKKYNNAKQTLKELPNHRYSPTRNPKSAAAVAALLTSLGYSGYNSIKDNFNSNSVGLGSASASYPYKEDENIEIED